MFHVKHLRDRENMTNEKIEWTVSDTVQRGELGGRTVLIGKGHDDEVLVVFYSSREQLEETGVGTVYRYESPAPAKLKAIKLLTTGK